MRKLLAEVMPELRQKWDEAKNKERGLVFDEVSWKSHKIAWWKCSKCGTSWEAPISRISSGGGCPECGKVKSALSRSTADYNNSLASKFSDLLDEWDYEKNGELLPEKINFGSNRKVWWKCPNGHSFGATVSNRTAKKPTSCPYCQNKKVLKGYNDLSTKNPEIAKEWDFEKNELKPNEVVHGSNKKVWWRCKNNHSYREVVEARTGRGNNCPYCSGRRVQQGFNDVATTHPAHIEDWNYDKNTILPTEVTAGSNKKVWWKCTKCGHEWQAMVSTKTRAESGCPLCVNRIIVKGKNDFATEHPELMLEWSDRNTIDPTTIASRSGKKAWWKCSKCGSEWLSVIYNRVVNGSGCPDCAQRLQTSMPEQVIYQYLKRYYPTAVNRYKAEWLKGSELDIYIPDLKCGIEYDGARWHQDKNKDEKKSALVNRHGISLIRVREEKCPVLDNDDAVITVKKYDQNIDSLRPVLEKVFIALDKQYGTGLVFDSKRDWESFTRDFIFEPLTDTLADNRPDLLKEWDYERNGNLMPEYVSVNSSRKVWWKCQKCGASYNSQVHSRNSGTGCPYCANKKVLKGFNDLQTCYPEIAKEWDPIKNETGPDSILARSHKKAWWICSKCGHEWQIPIVNRTATRGTGCPTCAHQAVHKTVNDLETLYPEIAKEWDPIKNDLKPNEVLPISNKRAWWICPKGHSYDMPIQSRTHNKSNCPFCGSKRILKGFNDLQTRYPEIAKEWDYEKNGSLTPDGVFPGSNKRYWWKCSEGHEWEVSPNNRTSNNRGCPFCARSKNK